MYKAWTHLMLLGLLVLACGRPEIAPREGPANLPVSQGSSKSTPEQASNNNDPNSTRPPAGEDGRTTPQGSCDQLLPPAPGDPVVAQTDFDPHSTVGLLGMADGHGTVLLILEGQSEAETLNFYNSSGALLSSEQSWGFYPLAQRNGFEGIQNLTLTEPQLPANVSVDLPNSQIQSQYLEPVGKTLQANNPRGGIMALLLPTRELRSYNDMAQLRWSTTLPISSPPWTLGVDVEGNTLVLYDGSEDFENGAWGGIWVDPSGHPGLPFRVGTNVLSGQYSNDQFSLSPAAEGGLFLKTLIMYGMTPHWNWPMWLSPKNQAVSPSPDWLALHPQVDLYLIHGGTGYAMVEGCSISVLTTDGQLCGVLNLQGSAETCSLSIGYDGTVITQPFSYSDCSSTGDVCHQTSKWWPAYFK